MALWIIFINDQNTILILKIQEYFLKNMKTFLIHVQNWNLSIFWLTFFSEPFKNEYQSFLSVNPSWALSCTITIHLAAKWMESVPKTYGSLWNVWYCLKAVKQKTIYKTGRQKTIRYHFHLRVYLPLSRYLLKYSTQIRWSSSFCWDTITKSKTNKTLFGIHQRESKAFKFNNYLRSFRL